MHVFFVVVLSHVIFCIFIWVEGWGGGGGASFVASSFGRCFKFCQISVSHAVDATPQLFCLQSFV